MSAEQARAYGIIDEVYAERDKPPIAASPAPAKERSGGRAEKRSEPDEPEKSTR